MYFNEETVKEYFKEWKIPYDKLDKGIIDLVFAFNFIGFKTTECCVGHDPGHYPYIIFDGSTSEYQVMDLLSKIDETMVDVGDFEWWIRKAFENRVTWKNWMWQFKVRFDSNYDRLLSVNEIVKCLDSIYLITERSEKYAKL